MNRFFKSSGFKLLIIIMAALIAGSVISVASRSGSSPLTKAVSVVFGPASRLASSVTNSLKNLPLTFRSATYYKNQNKALQKEIDSLREQLVDYENIVHDNEFYKEFLGLKEEHSEYEFAQASIIGRDAADRFSSFTLNKGSVGGIAVNDPVIFGKYLVGVVTSVTPTQCTVSTILNPSVNVSAYDIRSDEVSYVTTTVEYSKKNLCVMPGLSAFTAVTAGSIICTTGIGGIYPADLIIGTVSDIVDATVDISASAVIEPGVDFSQLTSLIVITSFNGQKQ
ncbi:MAG: rod shape-determining protein MreC [Clostridia bacterium]|nr:rod shape-determining protein MreC [Clostridia bacterium]